MPFSSGTFSVFTPGTPYSAGNTISSSVANSVNTDFATGLSTAILKDGSQTITANIPFSNFKLTGLGAGTALTDSATLRQVQYGFGSFLTSVAGTNTITGTATPTPAYTVGQLFTFVPAVTNTGATTLNISSVGAGAVQWVGAALTGGELVAGNAYTVYVTAATPVFEIVGATQFPDSRALVVGATDATKKLRFEVDGLTTSTTRVVTVPDRNVTIGGTLGTAVATTSGTAFSFTGIPAGVRRVTMNFAGVSLSGTDDLLVQIGPVAGVETTNYVSTSVSVSAGAGTVAVSSTAGFIIFCSTAADVFSGSLVLELLDSATNLWAAATSGKNTTTSANVGGGDKAIAGALSVIKLLNTGSDTFDAGMLNISYE